MKHFYILVCVLGLLGVACDEEGPTSSSVQSTVLAAQLSAGNEAPPVAGTEAGANGTVAITFTPTAGGYTADFAVGVTGFPPTSVIFAGHIHEGGSGVNGPIRVNTGLSQTAPIVTPTGGAALTFTGVQVTTEQAQAIFNNPAGYYFNLHTPLNPGGVVRGQLVRR